MKQYIGSKVVTAEPMRQSAWYAENNWAIPTWEGWDGEGYKVRYEDGYESWSPKEVFEAAYRRTDGLSFGLALEAAKKGMRIARKGWNGKGQYVELGTCFQYTSHSGDVPKSTCVQHTDIGSTALVFCGTRGRQVGWLASQADMLADDWCILEDAETMHWDEALEEIRAGAAVRREGWTDASWVAVLEEPAELKGKVCKVCPDTGDVTPDWKPEGEELEAGDWRIVGV